MALAKFEDTVLQSDSGRAYAGIVVEALSGGEPVQLYRDAGGSEPASQITTNANGLFTFWVGEGTYTIRYSLGGVTLGSQAGVEIYNLVKAADLADEEGAENVGVATGDTLQQFLDTLDQTSTQKANADAIGVSGADANMGTTPGTILSDNGTAKQWFQESEAAIDDLYAASSNKGAALVGFKSTIATSVERTAASKLRETVSVKDFGAVGDGVTDDRAAINLCLASVPDGSTVMFPEGGYALSGAISVPNSKSLTLQGAGDGSRLRRIDVGATGFIFDCGSGTDYPTRLVIRDLFFQGAVSGTSNGILLTKCNTARVEGCTFQLQGVGVQSVNSFAIELTSNVFDVMSFYAFIATTACHNAIIKKNNFFTAGSQAVRFEVTSDNLVIDENDFEYCAVGIRLNGCTSVSIKNNYIEYSTGKHIEFLGTNRCVDIESNWIALGSGGAAILDIENVNGGVFRSNRVYNQSVVMQASAVDVDLGINYHTGTGSISTQNWQAPTLLNSWAQQANYAPVGYRKDANNNVHLRGNLTGGAAGSVVFQLPAGYRPGSYLTFPAMGGGGAVWLEIRPNGDVFTATAPSGLTALNGVYFKAEG